MKFKNLIKYLVFLILMVCLGFLYSFSSLRNEQKKVSNIIVQFEDGENNFLTHLMVNKL